MSDAMLETKLDYGHTIAAIGWLSGHLAGEADAWNGNAPEWFPQPPEWLELWEQALMETNPNDSSGA
jgi:hypothetical protein